MISNARIVCLCKQAILATAVLLAAGSSASAQHRYPPTLPFDPRPTLSGAAVGAASLEMLTAAADAAMASEYAEVYLPAPVCEPVVSRVYVPPPPRYGYVYK